MTGPGFCLGVRRVCSSEGRNGLVFTEVAIGWLLMLIHGMDMGEL